MKSRFHIDCPAAAANRKLAAACLSASLAGFSAASCAASEIHLTNDSLLSNMRFVNAPLKTVMLNIGRASGVSLAVDPAIEEQSVSADLDGVHASQALERLATEQHLKLEPVGDTMIYVSKESEADKPAPIEPATAVPVAPPQTLDEALAMAPTAPPAIAPVPAATTSVPPPTSSVPVATTSKKPFVLQGNVEHRERLEPVDKTLRVGTAVSIAKLRALTPGNQWCRIPNWAAGTWKTVSLTAYYHYNYEHQSKNFTVDTFMDKAAETIGWQRDRNGDVWHFIGSDYYTIAEGATKYDIDYHKFDEVIASDKEHFVVRHIAVRGQSDKATSRVVRVFQIEGINSYTLGDNGTLRCKSSIKEFDDDGKPVSLQKGISYETRKRPFISWDTYRGRDMRKLFAEFLLSHGYSDLVPRD